MLSREAFHESCRRGARVDVIANGIALTVSVLMLAAVMLTGMFFLGREIVRAIF